MVSYGKTYLRATIYGIAYKFALCGLAYIPAREVRPKSVYIFRTIFPLGMALALTGCATTRYVTVSCVTRQQYTELKSQEPPFVKEKTVGMKADGALPIAVGSAIRLRAYADGLLGVLGGCVDPNKP